MWIISFSFRALKTLTGNIRVAGVIMEAMTFGVPCVASNIPCITDLVEHGKTGFLCHPKNINDFTDKVKMIIKNDTLKDKLGKAGLKKIKEFDWKKIIVKYEKLYQDPI